MFRLLLISMAIIATSLVCVYLQRTSDLRDGGAMGMSDFAREAARWRYSILAKSAIFLALISGVIALVTAPAYIYYSRSGSPSGQTLWGLPCESFFPTAYTILLLSGLGAFLAYRAQREYTIPVTDALVSDSDAEEIKTKEVSLPSYNVPQNDACSDQQINILQRETI